MTTNDAIRLERHSSSTSIVSLSGHVESASRQELVTVLAVAGERQNLLVDLSQAEHVDPSLVNAVLQTAEWLIGTPARLELVIPARAHMLRSLFETVSATGVAAVHATRAEALAALARSGPSAAGATAGSGRRAA